MRSESIDTSDKRVAVLIEPLSEYRRGIMRGIVKYSQIYKNWIFYHSKPSYIPDFNENEMLSQLGKFRPDGIFIYISNMDLVEAILRLQVPVIATMEFPLSRFPQMPAVISNNRDFGEMAANYLLSLGFENFAYCGFSGIGWSENRYKYYRKAIKKAGFRVFVFRIFKSPHIDNHSDEQALMVKWLKSLPEKTAIFTCNDDLGKTVIETCKISDIKIPDEMAILSVDNDELICPFLNPHLSSISVNFERAGYETAELLDSLMSGEKTEKKRIVVSPSSVITRQSTDILAIEDEDVIAAVKYIRNNSNKLIQVNDVAQAAGLSRRVLERKFKNRLNRTILYEIRHARVNMISQLLANTNLSVTQIAVRLGYTSINNLTRFFHQQTKMSPLAYRKKYGLR